MEAPISSLVGGDRSFHIDWLRRREAGHKFSLGYVNQFSKVLYSSVLPCSSWEQSKSIQGAHHGGVFNLEFSPDGSLLVAACEKRSFLMFDALSQKQVHAVENAHRDCVNCVRFLDSRTFVTCSDDSTVALWDARNLKSRIRTLLGHSNWVKNIEYSQNDGLLVTSGFDGSIYTWDINSYTESGFMYERVFHTNGLMRTRLTPDASKMIICTTGGYLMIIHDLNLRTLSHDLVGFKPNMYRLMQQSQTTIPSASEFTSLFSKRRKRNRIEFISDFPAHNDAEVVSSLQIHPQGWCALSRNISHEELSEWTCVHDIQDRDEEECLTENDETSTSRRSDNDDHVDDTGSSRRGFRGFPNPNYNSESETDVESDSGWASRGTRGTSAPHDPHTNSRYEVNNASGSSSSSDSEASNGQVSRRRANRTQQGRFHALLETTRSSSTTTRLLNDSSPLFQEWPSSSLSSVSSSLPSRRPAYRSPGLRERPSSSLSSVSSTLPSRRPANRSPGRGDESASGSDRRRSGNIRMLRISADGQVQISDDDSSGEPALNVRVVESQEGSASSSSAGRRPASRARGRLSRTLSSAPVAGMSFDQRNLNLHRRQGVQRRNSSASDSPSTENDPAANSPPTRSLSTSNSQAAQGSSAASPSVETANAAAVVGAARQVRIGGQGNSPFPQNMELHVASADVWEALVVIQEARARRQHARRPGTRVQDRRELVTRFLRRLQDLNELPRQQESADVPGDADTHASTASSDVGPNTSSSTNEAPESSTTSSSGSGLDRPRRLYRIQRSTARIANRQAQAPASIALGHFLRNPTPATRTLVMIAPHEGGAQSIQLRVSPNSFSYQSQQLRMPRNHKIHQNIPRLSHFIEEPNVGKGFIKELCFSSDGRVMCSPFSYGIRLLAFTPDCQEISTSIPSEPPVKLYEVSTNMCHEDYVVSSKFSPTHCLLVSGCLKGKIVWHQPVL